MNERLIELMNAAMSALKAAQIAVCEEEYDAFKFAAYETAETLKTMMDINDR